MSSHLTRPARPARTARTARPARPARPVPAVIVAVALVLGLGACVSLPTEGPVVNRDAETTESTHQAIDIDARPPEEGASRLEVVTGFLDAMTAWPIQTSVAKQFLSASAANGWNPESATLVYSDVLPPRESGPRVVVELTDADLLDSVGGWRGAVGADDLELEFSLTVEDGEFRISDPPDALVVPATWFQQRFQQVSLFYFDPTARILVPEPVFLPEGEQRATSLVSALLAGPPTRLRDVVRTYLPPGLSVGLSVPVSDSGVADVNLVGEAPQPSPQEAELLVAQLAWTLRQDPEISGFRVRIGGQEVRLEDGESLYPVNSGDRFDPNGIGTSTRLYGLRAGRLLQGDSGDLIPVTGPFGRPGSGLLDAAVSPDGSTAAAITADGGTALVAGVADDDAQGADGEEQAPVPVRTGAADLARPTWDYAGRLWLLDRRPGGSVVWTVSGSTVRRVDVPGVSGEPARRLLVSRDGTRLVATVRRRGGDTVVGARVVTGARGRVVRSIAGFTVHPGGTGQRILDLAWANRTRLALLTPAGPGSLFEVDIVPVDGASVGVDTLSTIISGRVRGLAGPGTESLATYAVLPEDLVDVRTRENVDLPLRVDRLWYVG